MILYMDAFGPRPRLEEMADRLAAEGYVVLVPHVFYRQGRAPLIDTSSLQDPDARRELFAQIGPWMAALTPELAMRDADAYVDFLRSHDQVGNGPIGVTGYCMGGALALRTAAEHPGDVGAAAAFHPARLATDAPDSAHLLADRLTAEVYVAAADQDQGMPPEQQERLDAALTAAGVTHTCEQYDGAAHGFHDVRHGRLRRAGDRAALGGPDRPVPARVAGVSHQGRGYQCGHGYEQAPAHQGRRRRHPAERRPGRR
nr:dienelactone hydrolase family protein [Nocardioides panacis]